MAMARSAASLQYPLSGSLIDGILDKYTVKLLFALIGIPKAHRETRPRCMGARLLVGSRPAGCLPAVRLAVAVAVAVAASINDHARSVSS
jgi:hypothetical protein